MLIEQQTINLGIFPFCQNAGILLDNRRGMDLRANDNFRNSDGKMGNELLCLVDRWGLGLSL